MLHDRARIHVQAGAGGDGCTSFRREAHVPRGGPDGGDGGRGGDVAVLCDESLRDLQAFRRRGRYRAGRGGHGEGAQRHGAVGETLVLRVPPGTEIVTETEDEPVAGGPALSGPALSGARWELLAGGQGAVLARGGTGGKGNKRFATATRQAPRFAERGLPGEEGWLELRLKLLADIGLVGLPNAGKSSLLSRLTRAAPKIANYPFTTLSPVLGVLEGEDRQLVVADIPGLIEGASEGAGLGHDFLAHIERTRLLVHVLDLAPEIGGGEAGGAVANHDTIERELAAHDERLARLPRVLALSKADLVTPERAAAAVAEWRQRLGPEVPVIATSSATRAGLDELGALLLRSVPERPAAGAGGEADGIDGGAAAAAGAAFAGVPGDVAHLPEHVVFRPAPASGFAVERLGPRRFAVHGRGIELLLARHDTANAEALSYVSGRLRRLGVLRELEAAGFEAGDTVVIGGATLNLDVHG